MSRKNSLVKNASILMLASIISRIIGLIYRRPLGAILGSVGLGYYGYASNLYSILLLISSYSIPMAVSKIVSERLALRQYKNAHKVFKGALIYGAIVGGVTALVAFFLGGILLPANQQNALPALRVLAPTIFLSAILGVFRGYFQAHHSMTPTSVSQIGEQILNAIVSILAAWILVRNLAPGGGTQAAIYGAVGGTMGTAAGAAIGLVIMILIFLLNRPFFKKRQERDRHSTTETYGQVISLLCMMVLPIILTTFINNCSMYVDSYIYSALQDMQGFSADAISAAYGEFSNYYIPVINIPLAMASASAAALMPEVSASIALQDYDEAGAHVNKGMKLTMFIGIPCMIGLTVLAYPIMGVLFPSASDLAAKLLLTGSVYVLFTAAATVFSSTLQSMGRQKEALINAAIALGINILVQVLLLGFFPQLDIFAVMIANIVFSVAYFIFNGLVLRKYLGFRTQVKKVYVEPLLASVVMGAGVFGIYQLIFMVTRRPFIGLLISVPVGMLLYLVCYVIFSRTTEEEMRKFPLGSKLVVLLRFLRVYR